MARIAFGGFQHETNTFAPVKATLTAFEEADGWPGLTRGERLFEVFTGFNVPLAGFLDHVDRTHQLIPLCWASATPSAQVTHEAFESICGELTDGLKAAIPVDAVYLDLHGAMVTETYQDGETEILRRVRALVGNHTRVVASLDLHGNIGQSSVEFADALVAYRTYPHVDMARTGARCADLLDRILDKSPRLYHAFRQAPYLIPLTAQCTDIEPAHSLMRTVEALEKNEVWTTSLLMGFPPADIFDCGPAMIAYGTNPEAVHEAVAALDAAVRNAEAEFETAYHTIDEAIGQAAADHSGKPVILVDTQDNPGAGGNADTVGLLHGLLKHDVPDSALGIFFDPEVAAHAHGAGCNREIDVSIGAKSGFPGEQPLQWRFTVEQLGNGQFVAPGKYFAGARMNLGPMARLRSGNVQVIVASRKEQAADRAMFTHVGLDPSRQRLLGLKSSVHFRADLAELASQILIVIAPGPNVADPARLNYRNLRPHVRKTPARSQDLLL